MTARLLLLPLVALLAAAGPASGAQQEAREDTVVGQEEGVTFDFQEADLRLVLTALADAAGVSIVYSGLPTRTVTLRTAGPVPPHQVEELLESVARANGLRLERENGILRVVQREEAAGRRADTLPKPDAEEGPGGPGPRLFVHELRHAEAEVLVQTLRSLFGLGDASTALTGRRVGDTSLSETLRGDLLSAEREMDRLLEARRADRIPPTVPGAGGGGGQVAGPRATEEQGLAPLLEAPAQIVPDPRRNAVLVVASPRDYEILREAIRRLDTRAMQVLIEVQIVEVRRDESFALGTSIDVPADGEGLGYEQEGLDAGDVALQALGLGGVNAMAVLRALARSSDVTVLSRPVVLAENNKQARILVGEQRPFVQLFRALPSDASTRDQVVQFRSVGTELRIIPSINHDGYVKLSVLQEVSNATPEVEFGAPVISSREVETEVVVRDGHTAVLGGLVDRQREVSSSGVPVLRDIPLIGGLFGSRRKRDVATELFVLLTPHVVRTDEELRDAAAAVRGRERLEEPLSLHPPVFGADADSAGPPPSGAGLPFPDPVVVPPDTARAVRPDTTGSAPPGVGGGQ